MMKKAARSIAAAVAALLLAFGAAGCQPNPTTPPVVGKGNLEDKIKDKTPAPSAAAATEAGAGSASAAPAAAEKFRKTYENGKLVVNIDADIEQPAAGKLPVVKVTPRKFTQAEVDTFLQVLLQGKPAYRPKDKMTKAEIQQQLVEMKAMKSQAKEGDKLLDKINYSIAFLEEELKTAPETVERQVSDGKLKTDDMGGQELTVNAPLGKTAEANLSIYASSTGRTTSLWFTNEEQGESYLGTETALTGTPRGVTMTFEDAKALAERTVRDMGSDLKLADCSMGTCRDMSGKSGGSDSDGHQAYLFAFTREVNGVPSTYEYEIGGNVPQEDIDRADGKGEYIEPHPYERILMAIDDTGILEFQWLSPDTVGETVSENAETLPFEKIMETFEKQFFIRNALKSKNDAKPANVGVPELDGQEYAQKLREAGIYTAESIGFGEDVKTCTYTIDRVVLGLSRIAVKDKENEFMLVPVYDFFGTMKVEYNPETGYAGFETNEANHSFLTINAIDGSIINRSYGY